MHPVTRWLVVVVAAGCLVAGAEAQEGFPAWVGLFDGGTIGWLENENRIGALCPDPATLDACYEQHLRPMVTVYELHGSPDSLSSRVGDLIVVTTPGRGLSAHFRPAGVERAIPFTPDLFLQDWGYGPYFHQTVSEQRGEWVRVPPDPWEGASWIRVGKTIDRIITIQIGDILEMGGTGWYVVSAEPEALVLRAEQPGDLWCESGEPPAITPAEPERHTRAELLDARGHLVFRLKYLKGC